MKPINPHASNPLTKPSEKEVNTDTNEADWQHKKVTKAPSALKYTPTTRKESGYRSLSDSSSSRSVSPTSDTEIHLTGSEELEDSVFLDNNDNAMLGKNASITKTLGYGATAIVDLVEQTDSDGNLEKFALKRPKNTSHQNTGEKLLRREAEIMNKVGDHPNIVKCYGFHEVDNHSGLLFEYIDGQNIETLTITLMHQLKTGAITHNEFFNAYAHLQKQQLSALAHLEKQGIVHSDVKPFNCMFDKNTQSVMQLDFGQATVAGNRLHFGSEDFSAPDTFKLLKDLNADVPAKTADDAFSYGQALHRVLKELETGTAASFCHDADLSGFSSSERNARARAISLALEKYETIKPDNTYHKAIADDEKSLEQLRLRVASTTHPTIQDFDTLTETADALKNYIDPMVRLINGLLHPNQSLRALPSQTLHHKWFEHCIFSSEEAKKTQVFAVNNKA
ncbi:protein kinase domain-containing protein [Candidatus Sororendozoicomonas aggregata]|uniref:protein kinase domain-containing protein n=1 Tax=Candidatus Sororendozoicomonas aggregata TaxID=3073239 RepID=UPI002ED67471